MQGSLLVPREAEHADRAPPDAVAGSVVRVAVDATPLLGSRTGVGEFCSGALGALATRPELSVSAFAITWRRRQMLGPELPPGVPAEQRAMPARPLHLAWGRVAWPPVEWFVGRADVVHGTNFVVPPTRRAAAVVTVHDLTVLHYPAMCQPATLHFPALIRRAVARGAWVHTPSRFVAEEVVEAFGVDPGRVRAVAHGIPPRVVDGTGPGSSSQPAALALPAGARRYLLAIGTVEPRKDYPGLVAAFDRIAGARPDLALVIAGGEGWGSAALDEALASSGYGDRVVRAGYVDSPTLGRLLRGAVALVFPSVYEGFGLPPLEAMDAGVPVVATAAGAVPEVVGDGGLLVPPGDAEALAEALASVSDDPHVRAQLAARGRARAATFSWEACGAGLSSLYREAAAAR